MSQENVELVKRLYDAWRKEGFGVVPAVMDPDIEYVNPPYAVEPGRAGATRDSRSLPRTSATSTQPVGSSRSSFTMPGTGSRCG